MLRGAVAITHSVELLPSAGGEADVGEAPLE